MLDGVHMLWQMSRRWIWCNGAVSYFSKIHGGRSKLPSGMIIECRDLDIANRPWQLASIGSMNVFNKNFWRLSPCKIEVSVEHWKANGGFFGRGKAGRFPIVLLPGHFSVNADCYMFHCLPQVFEAWRRYRQNKGLCGLTLHDDNTSTPCHHWNAADPLFSRLLFLRLVPIPTPQWGAANAEIKVPSGENTELKRSPFKAWSRSVYSHTCYAFCQGFLLCLFVPFGSFTCIFSKTSPDVFLCWLWLTPIPV